MKQTPIRLGPLALLLTVISICLTILAILTFTTARADLRLAEKYAGTVQSRYELERRGQEVLSELARGEIAAGETDADGVVRTELEADGFHLSIALAPDGTGGYRVIEWRQTKEWEPDETIDNLWSGSFGKDG